MKRSRQGVKATQYFVYCKLLQCNRGRFKPGKIERLFFHESLWAHKANGHKKTVESPAGAHSLWVSFFAPKTIDAPLSPLPCSVSAAVRVRRRQHRGWHSPDLLSADRRTRAAGSAAAEFSGMCPPSLHSEAGGHSFPYGIVLTLNYNRDSSRSSSGNRPVAKGPRPA